MNSTTNLTHDCPLATLSIYTSGNLANVKAHGSYPSGVFINATQASSKDIHINTFDGDKAHNCSAYYAKWLTHEQLHELSQTSWPLTQSLLLRGNPMDLVTSGSFLGASPQGDAQASTTSSGSGCFSGEAAAVVKASSGEVTSKSMKDLAIGDKVLVSQQAGKTTFEEVFMFTHQSNERADSILLETSSGSSLQVTPDHYMLVQRALSSPESEASIIAAGKVQVGDRLWTMLEDSVDGQLIWSEVTSASRTTQQGLYNPHTPSGTMVVDGVAACTFPDRIQASLEAHAWITLPARMLHRVLLINGLRTAVNRALLVVYFTVEQAWSRIVPGMASLIAHAAKHAAAAS